MRDLSPRLCYQSPQASVWLADLPDALPGPADMALLDAAELRRLSGFKDQRLAAHFAASRLLARELAGRQMGATASQVDIVASHCPVCGAADHGPPQARAAGAYLPMSLSRSAGMCAVALSACAPLGVDLEAVAPGFDFAGVALQCLSHQEHEQLETLEHDDRPRAFFRCWARKEAVAKACGWGLALPFPGLAVHPLARGPVLVEAPPGGRRWAVRDLAAGDAMACALALPADGG